NGARHEFTLTHTSTDTTAVPAPVGSAAGTAPEAGLVRDQAPDSVYARHAVSPDDPPRAMPCLERGSLLLVGGGPTQPDIQARLVDLAGGSRARIVVIPTAHVHTADSAAIARSASDYARSFGVASVIVLHTFSRR